MRLITRNGHDWTDRLPAVTAMVAQVKQSAVFDGELVALRADGLSSFPDLQAALSARTGPNAILLPLRPARSGRMGFTGCKLRDRKAVLESRIDWGGMLRFSGHTDGDLEEMHHNACKMKLEGIVCKKADARYQAGRGHGWIKLKCLGREELIVLGWALPRGSRTGIGALHLGYFDPKGGLHYAGAVGTGFSDKVLAALRQRLEPLNSAPPANLLVAGDPLDSSIQWVKPELVAEVEYTAWSGSGRVRHAVYLGLREDKSQEEVIRDVADPEVERWVFKGGVIRRSRGWKGAIPPISRPIGEPPNSYPGRKSALIVVAKGPRKPGAVVGNVELSHPDKELWPGVSKLNLAEYWQAVATYALPGLARRPLSIVRCPDEIDGEHFFQKNGHGHLPLQIREGSVSGSSLSGHRRSQRSDRPEPDFGHRIASVGCERSGPAASRLVGLRSRSWRYGRVQRSRQSRSRRPRLAQETGPSPRSAALQAARGCMLLFHCCQPSVGRQRSGFADLSPS